MTKEDIKKLFLKTKDLTGENIQKLAGFSPKLITEAEKDGKIIRTIDSVALKELIGDYAEEDAEIYSLNWVGKRASKKKIAEPVTKTLRPIMGDSVDFENTKNLYIEGDNFEVLKLLRESYLNSIKMIYIDPPYNTGKDFVYKDNFTMTREGYETETGSVDKEGNKLFRNTTTNGRFHSNWISMMYERLYLARDLLKDEGVIFISIDDNEVANLRKICDELFGDGNFVAQIIVDGTPKNDPYVVSTSHEYCLVYVKDLSAAKTGGYGLSNKHYSLIQNIWDENQPDYKKIEEKLKEYYQINNLKEDNIANYKFADEDGVYRIGPIDDPQNGGSRDDRINPKTGKKCKLPTGGWRCTLETWDEWIEDNLIFFPETDTISPSKKTYISSDRTDVLRSYKKIQTRKDTNHLKQLFKTKMTPFSNPKPRELLYDFVKNCNDKEMVVLDFFSGSGTMAEVVMQINLDDSGFRKYILVQLQEQICINGTMSNKEKKIAQTAIDFLKSENKPSLITEIGKERIRRAGKKIKEENKDKDLSNLDFGFKVFRLSDSNMKDVYYNPKAVDQRTLGNFKDNIKEDRTPEDLVYQVLLDMAIPLDVKVRAEKIGKNKVFVVQTDSEEVWLTACFDEKIDLDLVKEIAKLKPKKVVFRDSSFKDDKDKVNCEEFLKHQLPNAEMRVI